MFRKGVKHRFEPLQIEAAFYAEPVVLKMNARVANSGF